MKVKELIAALQKMPQDAEVFQCNCYSSDDATIDKVEIIDLAKRHAEWWNSAIDDFAHYDWDAKEAVCLIGDHPDYDYDEGIEANIWYLDKIINSCESEKIKHFWQLVKDGERLFRDYGESDSLPVTISICVSGSGIHCAYNDNGNYVDTQDVAVINAFVEKYYDYII
jgi:hypothetical protein